MKQLFFELPDGKIKLVEIFEGCCGCIISKAISDSLGLHNDPIPSGIRLVTKGGVDSCPYEELQYEDIKDGSTVLISLGVYAGIDFQNRVGSKIGSGGQLSESQAAVERKERLRKLALETIDISKDPYFMRNHLGSYECKLCLTLHTTEGNYLAHTQGKRHQSNLGRRAAMEAKNAPPVAIAVKDLPKRKAIKIGRPGYKVTKSRDVHTRQRCLTFEIDYPDVAEAIQPRHRFMSSYEQKVEQVDKAYQYVLFACEPYETIAFKVPNLAIDKREGRFFTNWDDKSNKFVLQLYFMELPSYSV